MGIQAWSGLGSMKDNYSKKPYTIFCDAFEYPGQPHEVAIWGSEFPGTHHLHRVNDRERVTKGTTVAQPTALCYSHRMTQGGLISEN